LQPCPMGTTQMRVEYGRRVLEEALDVVIPERHKGRYSHQQLVRRGIVKWVVLGGVAGATSVMWPPGAPAGLLATPIVRAFDP
jgi:hypothetical protein